MSNPYDYAAYLDPLAVKERNDNYKAGKKALEERQKAVDSSNMGRVAGGALIGAGLIGAGGLSAGAVGLGALGKLLWNYKGRAALLSGGALAGGGGALALSELNDPNHQAGTYYR